MKSFIAIALFVAVAAAIPVDNKDAVITKQTFNNIGVDGHQYSYETSDGKSEVQEGSFKNVGPEQVYEVRGSFSYPGPDGVFYTVNYVANENGFQPSGEHIPKA
ncbi:flexible cuticle protein 12-like [Leptidea sinapis]|uniref:Uncharacterized protein n=1 Tax=Leptidea sinapis TaxID=189913 RepID=A0A5E4Q8B7_9NEOP|nr:flexible cuticle protein 12-like [Leptidea sinapis]VVC93593.1 unnamed protein product [Leptidea sinapis]